MLRFEGSALRQTMLLNLGLWIFSFAMFMGPATWNGSADLKMVLSIVVTSAMGFACCFATFFVILRTQTRSHAMATSTRMALVAACGVAMMLVHAYADAIWTVKLYDGVYPDSGKAMTVSYMMFTNILTFTPIHGVNVAGVMLIFSSRALHDRERSLAAAREMAQEAQLAALRFQINPHFLFNTLNAVTALIGSGRNAEAEAMVVRLSDFFRASLVSSPGAQVALNDELDLVGSYLDIEAARFGPRLRVDIDCPETLRTALVPHFLLQPLVENAIKYGVARTKRPVTITLRAFRRNEALILRVVDDGEPGPGEVAPGMGVGLTNVSNRLQALFGYQGRLTTTADDRGFVAEIEMPLRLGTDLKAAA